MSDILAEIIQHKQAETAAQMDSAPLAAMRKMAADAPPPRPFAAALQRGDCFPVIAEMKRRSPSKGVLCEAYHPAEIAAHYAAGGAACLSVLTDEKFFAGATAHLQEARRSCALPVLRKDFIFNEWQIYESRAIGADAILLIAAALAPETVAALAEVALATGMAVLLETHDEDEVSAALTLPAEVMIGINNRDLKTFHTDTGIAENLLPRIKNAQPTRLTVSESGIKSPQDVRRAQAAGADAFLIGETLMREPQSGLSRLFGAPGAAAAPDHSNKNIQP